jgi:hypothetical protein
MFIYIYRSEFTILKFTISTPIIFTSLSTSPPSHLNISPVAAISFEPNPPTVFSFNISNQVPSIPVSDSPPSSPPSSPKSKKPKVEKPKAIPFKQII